MIRKLTASFLLVLLTLTASGQVKTVATYLGSALKRADHLYDNQYYQEASELYLQALSKDPKNAKIKLQLAETFRKLNNPVQAAWWYGQIIYHEEVTAPEHKLYYAQALLSIGQIQQAKTWYARYQQQYTTDGRVARKLQGIDQMPTFYQDSLMYRVRPLDVNSSSSDFAPAFYQNGLVFISARPTKQPIKQIFRWNETPYLSMFFSPLDSVGKARESTLFGKNLGINYHEGPAVFYNGDTQIIFTRNHSAGKRDRHRVSNLGLFTAQRSKGSSDKTTEDWSAPTPLSLNNLEYSVGHPTLTRDGNALYFISDMPGGQGGADLYVSYYRNGTWQTPVNLGAPINTEGDEMFPFLHQDQTLYFSSDGHGGLGGLDIYKTELGSDQIENLGYPVNSPSDDFGLILNDEGTQGYYTSNQGNKPTDDDLYQISIDFQYLEIIVSDELTHQPISEAEVSLISDGAIEQVSMSDSSGTVRFRVNPHHGYIVNVDKKDYQGNAIIVGPEDMLATEGSSLLPVTLAREEGNIDLVVAIADNYVGQPLPYQLVTVVNTEKNDTTYRTTDGEGVVRMKVGNHAHYTFSGEVNGERWIHAGVATQALSTDQENKLSIAVGVQDPTVPLQLRVYDAKTRTPLEQTVVRLIEDGEQRAKLSTSADGEASFRVDARSNYIVSIEAVTHYDNALIITSDELKPNGHQVEVLLDKAEETTTWVASLYDSATGAPVANTIIRLRKEGTRDTITSVSDAQGRVQFKVEERGTYRMIGGTKDSFWRHSRAIKTESSGLAVAPQQISVSLPPNLQYAEGSDSVPGLPSSAKIITQEAPLRIVAHDADTGEPIEGATVRLIEEGIQREQLYTNHLGEVLTDVKSQNNYLISVEPLSHYDDVLIVMSEELIPNAEHRVTFLLESAQGTVSIEAQLYDSLSKAPLANTVVRIQHEESGKETTALSDEQGVLRMKVERGASYRVSGEAKGQPSLKGTLIRIGQEKLPNMFDLKIPVHQPLSYKGLLAEAQRGRQRAAKTEVAKKQISQEALRRAAFTVVNSPQLQGEDQQVWIEIDRRIYRLSSAESKWSLQHQDEQVELTETSELPRGWWRTAGGETTTINTIYFGFDKRSISKLAKQELDKIADLMKRQPTLRIEASTHADSRGPKAYNRVLSQQRAQSIRAYLMKAGISERRIYLKFYGKERLLHPCDQNDCQESLHRINRRGEFKISFIE